jgi:hypothetical protein
MKYIFDSKIKYRTFKKLWDTIPSGGIEPREACRMVWQLIQEKKIYAWYEKGDIVLSMEKPKGKMMLISNKKSSPTKYED